MAGLAAAGVDDAAARVAALEAERELARRGRGRSRRRARAARGPRPGASSTRTWTARGPAEPAPGGDRVGGVAARASRPARAPPPARPGPSSWRSGRAACARPGRRGRPARRRAARSRGRRRRRRRRRRRTRRRRLSPARLSADRLDLLAQPGRRAPRGRGPRRRRSPPRPRSARRSASLDPLLGRLGLRLDLRRAAPRRRRSPAPSPRARAAAPPRGRSSQLVCERLGRVCSARVSRSASSASISAVGALLGGARRPRPRRRSLRSASSIRALQRSRSRVAPLSTPCSSPGSIYYAPAE